MFAMQLSKFWDYDSQYLNFMISNFITIKYNKKYLSNKLFITIN